MAQPETSDPVDVTTDDDDGLGPLRERIDAIDREILRGLNERARVVQRVGELKRTAGSPVYEPSRERRIVEALSRANEGPFPDAGIAPGTAFEDLPEDWECPQCGVGKDMFEKVP